MGSHNNLQVQSRGSTLGSHLHPHFHALLNIVYIASSHLILQIITDLYCICIGRSRDPLQAHASINSKPNFLVYLDVLFI